MLNNDKVIINISQDVINQVSNLHELRNNKELIYHVDYIDRNMKIIFFVTINKSDKTLTVHMYKHIYFSTVDDGSGYPSENPDGTICDLDPYLQKEHFEYYTSRYGIEIEKIQKLSSNAYVLTDFTIDEKTKEKLSEEVVKEFNKQILKK